MNYVCKEQFNFKIDNKEKKKSKNYQNNREKMNNYKEQDKVKQLKKRIK